MGKIKKEKIIWCLLALAVVFALIPVVYNVYLKALQEDLINEYKASTENYREYLLDIRREMIDIKKYKLDITTNNTFNSRDIKTPVPEVKTNKYWDVGSVMGYIKIDKINVNLPVVQGSDLKSLKLGVGHMIETDLPGQIGNCALAGHRSYTYGKMFNRLGEVKIGDLVEVNYENTPYLYKIYEILIVEPTNLSVLNRKGDNKVLTLITCHPIDIANKRLILHGKLLEKNINKYDELHFIK